MKDTPACNLGNVSKGMSGGHKSASNTPLVRRAIDRLGSSRGIALCGTEDSDSRFR